MTLRISPTLLHRQFPLAHISAAVSTIVLCLGVAACLGGENESARTNPSVQQSKDRLPVVILLGDSIRGNYQATVKSELEGKAIVYCPKENCQHSLFTLENLEKWVKGRNASVVHINVGLHDLYLSSKTGQPRHSLDVYSANLRKIFAKLRELTDAQVIFALTTPVDEPRQASSKTYKRVVRRNPHIVKYNLRAAEIAKGCGASVDDVHTVAVEAGIENVICNDGVHLTKKGMEVVGKQVARSVLAALGETR